MGKAVSYTHLDVYKRQTHEEAVTDLARHFIDSYKQLPSVVYHIQTKFRDEPRCRGGLIRVREFIMKDAYSFHVDEGDLRSYYPYMCQAYERICKRCGVPVVKVLSDVGMMGGDIAHEFTYVTDSGEDTIILCDQCGYAANRDVAKFDKTATTQEPDGEGKESLSSPEEVHTPSKNTIESVCDYLGVSPTTSLKTMVYFAQDREDPVLVVIRGDLDLSLIHIYGVSSVAIGMVNKEELEMNLRIFEGDQVPEDLAEKTAHSKKLIIQDFCRGCGSCVDVCPNMAMKVVNGKAVNDKEKCILCGYCAPVCPEFAIRLV